MSFRLRNMYSKVIKKSFTNNLITTSHRLHVRVHVRKVCSYMYVFLKNNEINEIQTLRVFIFQ